MAAPGYRIVNPDGSSSAEFDSDALMWYARQGNIQPQTAVYDPTVGRTVFAGQMPDLQDVFAPAGPPAGPYSGYRPGYVPPKPRSSATTSKVVAAVLIGMAVVVIAAVAGLMKVVGGKQTVTTADGHYAISVPWLWRQHVSENHDVVDYASDYDGVAMVRVGPKLTSSEELDMLADVVARQSADRHGLSAPVVTATTVAGLPARQFTLSYRNELVLCNFRHTIVETPDADYDILQASQTPQPNRAKQDAMLASFHRVR